MLGQLETEDPQLQLALSNRNLEIVVTEEIPTAVWRAPARKALVSHAISAAPPIAEHVC